MYQGMHYQNGQFILDPSSRQFETIDPTTGQVYGKFPQASHETVYNTVQMAHAAQRLWKLESRVRRADYFDKLAQLLKRDHRRLVDAIVTETGKNRNEAHAEVIEALHMCQVAAASGRQPYGEVVASELPTKDSYVIRKPRGVVAVISPWNFPLAIGSFWCAAPAIVEGNTVIHKPSELTPMVNQIVAELYHEAGFPKGVFNLIHGDGQVGEMLVSSKVDVILFTGSAEVGQQIKVHCATNPSKTCSIECGSKSATMVFEDGNLDLAIDVSLASAFKLSGQRCVSSGRILVQESIFEEFKTAFCKACVERVFLGEGIHPWRKVPAPIDIGPMISADQKKRVEAFNQMVRDDKDAVVLIDCHERSCRLPGYFLGPFVYTCQWAPKPFLRNEVFGPHVALIPFKDLDDAIRIYNDTDYGLALGAVTDDFRKHRALAQECTTGMLYINGGSIAAESHLPFSSWKKSGWGSSASATWKAVTHTMSVTVNYEEGKVSWAQGMK